MFTKNVSRSFVALSLLLILALSALAGGGQERSKKKPKKEKIQNGTPVLWRKPVDIATRDLYWGPGGAAMKPDLRRVTFIEEQKGGYSKKYRVRDASGHEWVAKIGKEAQSETAAVRLLWAAGYETEINYLEPHVQILGKGNFDNVRFEARPSYIKRLDQWKWSKNPFVNSIEFQGLKVMMALINNWDIKDSNNKILLVRGASGNELKYIISDLGATFGQSSRTPIFWRITRSRNNPVKYAKAGFVDVVKNNHVYFEFGGKRNGLFRNITVEDARWMGSWLSKLSPRQIKDAFRAANYSPVQIALLSRAVVGRINELVSVPLNERIGRTR